MMIARTVMTESGLGARFWFKAASAGKDARNVTFEERIRMMHSGKRGFSDLRTFGCRTWVYLDKQRREKGKHTPRAKEAIYVGFANNISAWAFWIPEDKTIMALNQVKFCEYGFPFRTRKMLDQFISDNLTDILYQHTSDVTWVRYTKLHVCNYGQVHYDTMSDVVVLKVMSKEITYTRAIKGKRFSDKVALGKVRDMKVHTPLYALHAGIPH
jgi:hypothetical protein